MHLGTGLSSTLLSSQKTTTHHNHTPERGPDSGASYPALFARHFNNVTCLLRPCQPGLDRFVASCSRVSHSPRTAQNIRCSLIMGCGRPAAVALATRTPGSLPVFHHTSRVTAPPNRPCPDRFVVHAPTGHGGESYAPAGVTVKSGSRVLRHIP